MFFYNLYFLTFQSTFQFSAFNFQMTISNQENQENQENHNQIDFNHQGNFIFDNLINILEHSINTGLYDTNNRNCHLSIIRQMAMLDLTTEQSNWIIGQLLDGENPIRIFTGFIIRFIPSLPFDNMTIINNARIALENAFNTFVYERNTIADALNELIELPLSQEQYVWINTQITLSTNPIQIMMSFLENFVIRNLINNNIEYNEIIIHQIPGPNPLNPLAYFNQMPEWFYNSLMISLARNTGIDYNTVQWMFNQHENILSVVMYIFTNYVIIDDINIRYRDRNTNQLHNWTFLRN